MTEQAFQPIGHLLRWARRDATFDLFCQNGRVRVQVLTSNLIRVRATPMADFGPDESWAVVKSEWDAPAVNVEENGWALALSTSELRLEIGKEPLRLRFYDAQGRLLSADEESRGMGWQGGAPVAYFALPDDEHILGLGEKVGPLDKRDHRWEMWNTDAHPRHLPTTDPMYESFPVYLGLRPGLGYARFFDNTWRSHFDFGYSEPGVFRYDAAGGELNYYFLYGPEPAAILARYSELTGRMPMPPRWALGHQQCRWSYYPEAKVREVAQKLRSHGLPTDVIYLDIDYMDGYRVFTWDRERFPDPKKLIADLRAQGFRTVTIVDPGVKVDEQYDVYREGVAHGYFCKKPDGSLFVGPVWPGDAVFPDFTHPEVRRWWGDLHQEPLLDMGVAGIWNDMNEPAVFGGVGWTMDEDVIHYDYGHYTPHSKSHNVYGLLMTRATREALERMRPNERAFVLTRAAYAGVQRYAAVWMGDNSSWWEHLWLAMPMCLSVGLAGQPFVGVDIGGFSEDCTPELYARWVQLGAFTPLCRTHTALGTRDQEPYAFGPEVERIARRYLELRYRLLPYIYTLFWEASQTGAPIMRPLVYAYPDDPTTYEISDQFLWGHAFLVAPIYQEKVTHRAVYLPAGRWIDYWTGRMHEGPSWIVAEAPLDTLPLYVRAGSIIPTGPAMQYTDEKPLDPLTLEVFGGGSGRFTLYEDDGLTMAYREGDWAITEMIYEETSSAATLTISARQGKYRPAPRRIIARFHGWPQPTTSITLDGQPVAVSLDQAVGMTTLSWADDGRAHEIVLQRV
ncbi:MAG: glycoside hydrolase family 31 protein [Anaerolineae bacterium]|nr:glycoside hydrolase family 31 protein [Anaerolineae bacterium]MDW8100738.1 glycoside hydrolase family 31 protein [Anaerolineae bacterium]